MGTASSGRDAPRKFGVCWQIVPAIFDELMSDHPSRAKRVTDAMVTMIKFDIAALEKAALG